MRPSRTRERIIQVLQNTLVEVEASSGVNSDDPALLALKRVILRRVAHLELAEAEEAPLGESSSESSSESSPPPVEAIPVAEVTAAALKVPPQTLSQEPANGGAGNGQPSVPGLNGPEEKIS